MPAPIASRDLYWRLIDGNQALSNRDFVTARRYYRLIIDSPATLRERQSDNPTYLKAYIEATKAAARFQLMYPYLANYREYRSIDREIAMQLYRDAQAQDGIYAKWSAAFVGIYQKNGDIDQAFFAAREAIDGTDIPYGTYFYQPDIRTEVGGPKTLCSGPLS